MNSKQMRAQLDAIKPAVVATTKAAKVSEVSASESSWLEGTAHVLGAVPSATVGFFSDIGTSYKYHEAKRKGLIG